MHKEASHGTKIINLRVLDRALIAARSMGSKLISIVLQAFPEFLVPIEELNNPVRHLPLLSTVLVHALLANRTLVK